MRCAVKRARFDLITLARSVESVVEEGETARCFPWPPGRARWSDAPRATRQGSTDRGSLLQEGDDDTEELFVGVVEDRLVEISGTVSRCTRHTSLLPPVAAVAHPVGTPPMPTNDPHATGPQLAPPGRRPRCGPGCGRRRCAPRRTRRRRPRGGACRGRLGYRWSRSPTIRRTAAPSATDRRNRPWGRASSQDQGVLSGGVLDCGGGDIGGRRTSVQLGGGRTPAPGTLRSTRRVAQGARRVRGRSMLTGTVLMWSSRSESQSSGWARAA